MSVLTLPESCAIDGVPQRGHGRRWHPTEGCHVWREPYPALILERVRALREAAAVLRYRQALADGLSDYEARAEGWPQ